MATTVTRAQLLAHRVHTQQLDRDPGEREITDAAAFDLGIQDTGRDGASWALANRGVPVCGPAELESSDEVALAWTLRGAAHYYRRHELFDVMVATSPLSEADASKRVFDASTPLGRAGIATIDGLAEIAQQLRRIVDRPRVKGEVSRRLTEVLDPPYLRRCVPCQATHAYENPFRLAALYGGLELEPGTSPPVLRRIPGWPRRVGGPATDPTAAPNQLQPVRGYLRLYGPADPKTVAAFLDAPVAEVKKVWPNDAEEVELDGARAWQLGELGAVDGPAPVRLLGPFDTFLQGRDRDLILPDRSRHKALWPTIGRPGGVLVGTEIGGIWRPKAAGSALTVRVERWGSWPRRVISAVEEQAERLAAHRGVTLKAVDEL